MRFILDLIFPKKCVGCNKLGQYFCDNCFSHISFNEFFVCPICERQSINGMIHIKCEKKYGIDGIIPVLSYNSIIKKAIYQFKYPPYISDLKWTLSELMHEGLIQNESFVAVLNGNPIIIPIPLSKDRFRKRGYNQSELLSKCLSKRLALPEIDGVLKRIKKTKPQYLLSKEERLRNIKNSFLIEDKLKGEIAGKTVILIDDIVTTGATLRECAKVLKRNGVKMVYGITLAKEQGELD